jgi:hypothetical protein
VHRATDHESALSADGIIGGILLSFAREREAKARHGSMLMNSWSISSAVAIVREFAENNR